MQNKKVTMLAAVLAVTVIAMAGVGYAITYTATTTNTGNHMDKTYLTVTQDGATAAYGENFLTDLYFDSVNITDKNTTTYTPVYTGYLNVADYKDESETDETLNVALISKPLSLKVAPTNVKTGATADMVVTVSNSDALQTPLDLETGLTYVMVVKGGDYAQAAEYTNHKWTFESLPVSAAIDYSVQLFVKSDASIDVPETGFANGTGGLTSVFKFSLEVTQN